MLNLNQKQYNHYASQLAVEPAASQDTISTTASHPAYNVIHLASPVLAHPPTVPPATLSTT
jgi:hypothetical protein